MRTEQQRGEDTTIQDIIWVNHPHPECSRKSRKDFARRFGRHRNRAHRPIALFCTWQWRLYALSLFFYVPTHYTIPFSPMIWLLYHRVHITRLNFYCYGYCYCSCSTRTVVRLEIDFLWGGLLDPFSQPCIDLRKTGGSLGSLSR